MKEITMSLDGGSSVPLYEQIYQFLKQEIQRRQILPLECLPSTRALAKHLQVSRTTVDLAYSQLVSEGYIEAIPCKGYFVCQIDGLYEFSNSSEVEQMEEKMDVLDYQYDFALNGIGVNSFPHNQWRKISREILNEDDSLFLLGDSQGDLGIRTVLASYLHHARGVKCHPNQIIVGAGNDYLLMMLRVILGEGKQVAMENPTYKNAWQGFSNLGYQVCGIEMDEAGMRVDELEKSGADIAYVMPSHQFPMGYVMPLKRRSQLLSWAAAQKQRYIIEDDYDSEFRYKGKPIPALQGYDRNGTVIYLGTFSKSIAPAIRISYMVLPPQLMKEYEKRGKSFSVTVSRVDQKIIEVFLRDGYYERHLNRMRALYKNKHDYLLMCLKEMTHICTVSGENAGVHVVLKFVNGISEKDAVRKAAEAGIKVYGISEYYISDRSGDDLQGVLLGYATLEENEIRDAVEQLKIVWN